MPKPKLPRPARNQTPVRSVRKTDGSFPIDPMTMTPVWKRNAALLAAFEAATNRPAGSATFDQLQRWVMSTPEGQAAVRAYDSEHPSV